MLQGKTVVISGAGPGLGRETALVAAREGANVVLGARRKENLEAIAADVSAAGGSVAWSRCDICDAGEVAALVSTAVDRFGGVDSLINVAALDGVFGGVADTSDADFRATIETNVFGTMGVVRAALPHLKAAKGSIVFVGTQTMFFPPKAPQQMAYAASKGALLGAARHLTMEVGPAGVRVNTVAPGWMYGPPVQTYIEMTAKARGVSEDEVLAEFSAMMPLGRLATDGDVAEVIIFMASERARGVTGQSIIVNAGEFMQ